MLIFCSRTSPGSYIAFSCHGTFSKSVAFLYHFLTFMTLAILKHAALLFRNILHDVCFQHALCFCLNMTLLFAPKGYSRLICVFSFSGSKIKHFLQGALVLYVRNPDSNSSSLPAVGFTYLFIYF